MIDLSNPSDRDKLAEMILQDIDEWSAKKYNTGHRDHLGASLMGDECSRKLWYNFRWVKEEYHAGRIQRLFQVGHQAEPRFIEYLRGIGFEVWERDTITNEQFRILGCNGHYGGSLDGKCKAPSRYEISEELIFLDEFKTNGTGSGFTSVADKGVAKAKPQHWAQMCQYGWKKKLKYALYLIENKNDSNLTIQIVELDWRLGQELEKKAGDIINSKFPPPRIAENPSFFNCINCTYKGICHEGEPVEINCRSCISCQPIENGEWYCHRWNAKIPKDAIKKGCSEHTSINEG